MRELNIETPDHTDTEDIKLKTSAQNDENDETNYNQKLKQEKYSERTENNGVNNGETCTEIGRNIDDRNIEDISDVSQPEEEQVAIETDEEEKKAPDGGWGWFVVLGLVLSLCITGGIQRSGGILYLKIDDQFKRSASATSWVLSVSGALGMCSGPIASSLSNRFSVRSVCIFGGILSAVGILISGFIPDLEFLYFSFGLLNGFGRSCTHVPALVLVGLYFDKRRGIAIGLSTAGIGFGSFIIPPAIDHLFNEYGYTGAFILMSGLVLNVVVCSSLYRPLTLQRKLMAYDRKKKISKYCTKNYQPIPVTEMKNEQPENTVDVSKESAQPEVTIEVYTDNNLASTQSAKHNAEHEQERLINTSNGQASSDIVVAEKETISSKLYKRICKCCKRSKTSDSKKEKKKFLELSLLKDFRFLSFGLTMMFYTLAFRIILVFLPAYAKQKGISDTQSAYLLSISGILDTVSRIASGAILDIKQIKPYRITVYCILIFLLFVLCLIIPSIDTFIELCVLSGFIGCFSGSYMSQKSMVAIDILGVEKITSSFGLTMLFQGIGSLIGPPIS
ncbi:hypothetical protein KUTeg_021574, partial [Tegillarca granosa]